MTPRPLSRRHLLAAIAALPTAVLLAACGKRTPKAQALPDGATVLALGDSLTQGVGARPHEAWPTLLAAQTGWDVVNAGVSGDTSAQALDRLPELLDEHAPQLVIVGIGGNDFLRQVPAATTRDNIQQICQACHDGGAQVLLLAVPQFSLLAASTGRLSDHPLYAELAQEMRVPLYAKGWAEVLSDARLRSDQVHANAQGYSRYADGLAQWLRAQGWVQG